MQADKMLKRRDFSALVKIVTSCKPLVSSSIATPAIAALSITAAVEPIAAPDKRDWITHTEHSDAFLHAALGLRRSTIIQTDHVAV